MTYKILCTDGFAEAGLQELKNSPLLEVVFEKSLKHEDLLEKIPAFDGLIVRSASTVSRDVIERGGNLKIIARAGVGIDNIDVEAATERGIYVVNAPAGNTTSTAELAFTFLLSLARHVPQAAASMTAGQWEKKKFMGNEVANKTLGIVGLGRIGREVARRAKAFNMNLLIFDPYVREDQCSALGGKSATVHEICKSADFITVHTPLTKETENIIAWRELSMMKKTAYIINCARGGIINEEDLAKALKENVIAGAALDVFTKEPYDKPIFQGLENVILTPHLGASTKEAQNAVAVEAARAVANFFSEGISVTAVNLPAGETQIQEYKSHIQLAEKLGSLAAQLTNDTVKKITLLGPPTMPKILMLATVKGVLLRRGDNQVTLINASVKAAKHGIALSQDIVETGQDFAGAFGVLLEGEKDRQEAWGAVLEDGTSRVVMCDGHHVEISPEGSILLIHNNDRPGVIGKVSSILGDAGVNIAEMQNVRERKGADALTIIRIDDVPSDKTLEEIRKINGVERAILTYL